MSTNIDNINIKSIWINGSWKTAKLIKRGYTIKQFNSAIKNLKEINVKIIVHLILGLPNENKELILQNVKYISNLRQHIIIIKSDY